MKKTLKLFGIIALIATIGFSMAACQPDDDGGDGSTTNPFVGTWTDAENSWQVEFTSTEFALTQIDYYTWDGTYTYNGNTATLDMGATGTITGNILTLNIPDFDNITIILTKGSGGGGNAPGAPTGVSATAQSSSSISVSWSSVSGATGYYIYRSSTSSGTYSQVGSSTTTSYTDTGLSASTAYHYRVAAYNSNGTSSQSSYVSATTQSSGGGGNAPSTPTGVSATAQSSSSVSVSWGSVSGATGYYIYRSSTSSGTYSQVGSSTTTSYTDTGLSASTAYHYRVAAYNSNGTSSQSSYVSATTQSSGGGGNAPSTPTGVSATAQSSSSVSVSWGSVSGATGYYIYRSSTSSGTYSQVGSSTTTSYTDTGLSASTTYHYRVAAYNSNGTSSQSSSVSATTQSSGGGGTVPGTPTGVTASRNPTGSTTVRVSWNAVNGATSYKVYYSSTGSGSGSLEGSPTTTSFDSTNNSTTGTHYFRVSAVNSTGEGSPSSWVSVGAVAPTFVAVTSITGVPTSGTAGTPLTLTGTVNPSNATNKTIIWSVNTAGTTGATISGSTLNTTAAGTVSVRATITNGASATSNYTTTFNITISAAPLTLQSAHAAFLLAGGSSYSSVFTTNYFTWNASSNTLSYNGSAPGTGSSGIRGYEATSGSPASMLFYMEMEAVFNTSQQITTVRYRYVITWASGITGLNPSNPTSTNPHRSSWFNGSTVNDGIIVPGVILTRTIGQTTTLQNLISGTWRRTN